MPLQKIDRADYFDKSIVATESPLYYSMYSSILDGVVTDSALMLIPVDDHIVHRGDGVFETLKCVNGSIYTLDAHIHRLLQSAAAIQLNHDYTAPKLSGLIIETIRSGEQRNALIRVLLSRGPGSMNVNPKDCPKPSLYIIVYRLSPPFMETHPEGASIITSKIPVKEDWLATIKTCNYLPNALMKLEAIQADSHFAIAFDRDGNLAEGPTENVALITEEGSFITPAHQRVLPGTTLARVMHLADQLVADGTLAGVHSSNISGEGLSNAAEVMMIGTTTNVTSVVRLDGQPVGNGRPGEITSLLDKLLAHDRSDNPDVNTPAF